MALLVGPVSLLHFISWVGLARVHRWSGAMGMGGLTRADTGEGSAYP